MGACTGMLTPNAIVPSEPGAAVVLRLCRVACKSTRTCSIGCGRRNGADPVRSLHVTAWARIQARKPPWSLNMVVMHAAKRQRVPVCSPAQRALPGPCMASDAAEMRRKHL